MYILFYNVYFSFVYSVNIFHVIIKCAAKLT